MSLAGESFMVGSDILDIGSRKAEARARRNRMDPLGMMSMMPTEMPIPHVPNVRANGCSMRLNGNIFDSFCRSHGVPLVVLRLAR